jgi:signal transduction histidine kinase
MAWRVMLDRYFAKILVSSNFLGCSSLNPVALHKLNHNPPMIGFMNSLANILLVEDNPNDIALLKRAMPQPNFDGWQLSEAETLADATALYADSRHQTFDLVLLDLGLPDSQGLDTLQQFRQVASDIPIVVLTGLNDQVLAMQAIDAGAQDYLVKDNITLNSLCQALQFAWQRHQRNRIAQLESASALQAAQKANELKTHLMGMVSHEFRNPLGVIQNALEVLIEQTDYPPQRWLERIQRATNQLLFLMEDILLLAHIQSGSPSLKLQTIEINRFSQEVIDNLSADNTAARVQFHTTKKPLIFRTDPHLLDCILTNLLNNALKYSPNDSAVDFVVSELSPDQVQFQIIDRGIGIPEIDQANILDFFYRASNVGKTAGTGLGLAIVQRCVDLLEGRMMLKSVENQGTTVTVTLRSFQDGLTGE